MSSTDLIYQSAVQHLAAGEWAAASTAAATGLRLDPHHGRLHEAAGVAAYHREEFGPAVWHLESASAAVPLGSEPQLLLADLYLRFGQTQAAGAILAFLAEPDRCPTPLLPELAKTLGRAGAYLAALDVCERLTAFRPTFHPAWFGTAFYLGRLGRPAGELEFPLRMAFDLAPHALPYRLNLAAVLADTGRCGEAYDLVAAVPPEAVGCGCLCRRFAAVCETVGDARRAAGFLIRAERLSAAADETAEFEFPTEVETWRYE
jgi:Flp pilus assembly protein TadD